MRLLLLTYFITACSILAPPPVEHQQPPPPKFETYADAAAGKFVSPDDCDSLLYTGLLGSVIDIGDITAYRNQHGQWFRTPAHDCFATGRASSTISRDMLLGLMWYIWANQRLDLAADLYDYGEARWWEMGEGDERVMLSINMQSTLAWIVWTLGGPKHDEVILPVWFTPGLTDYQAHLTVLHILLRQDILNVRDDNGVLRLYAIEYPMNPLFQAAAGNAAEARALLERWPDHPPTTEQWCSIWPVAREPGPNWEPCEPFAQHTGGELLWIERWLL